MNDKLDLVMIRWNKKNVKVLPVIPALKPVLVKYYKNEPRKKRKVRSTSLYLIAGINYIPRVYWEAVKKETMIQLSIDEGDFEEVTNTNPKIEKEIEKITAKKEEIKDKREEAELEIPELESELEKAKAELEKITDKAKKTEKQKEIGKLQKQIEKKNQEKLKLEQEESLTDEELKKLESEAAQFSKMSKKKKENLIAETFDIRTLKKFFEEEMETDVRHNIQKRMDKIMEAKVDETIDHPKSHVKTS